MNKILVVVGEPSFAYDGLVNVFPAFCERAGFDQVVMCRATDALGVFLTEEPTHVLVLGYSTLPGGFEERDANVAWRDLSLAADSGVKLLRSSWLQDLDVPHFIRMPFKEDELREAFDL